MSQSLPEVNVVSTLNRLGSGKGSTDKAVKEPSLSISQPEGDPEQIVASHPTLVKALSYVPYSPLFGVLWPIIIEQANFDTRDVLPTVNRYFERVCKPYRDSDLAKRAYIAYFGNPKRRKGLPFVLELSFGAEWRCWSADKCGFDSVEAFRRFCALGDIDPDQGCSWMPDALRYMQFDLPPPRWSRPKYIWMSRTKDIVIETSSDPLAENGYCGLFGLTGVADKAVAMYNFVQDKHDDSVDAPAMQQDGPK